MPMPHFDGVYRIDHMYFFLVYEVKMKLRIRIEIIFMAEKYSLILC